MNNNTIAALRGELQRVYLAFRPAMHYDERIALESRAYRLGQQIQQLVTMEGR